MKAATTLCGPAVVYCSTMVEEAEDAGASGVGASAKPEDAFSPFYGGVDGICPVCLEEMPPMTWRLQVSDEA